MILERLMRRLPIKSYSAKLYLGAILAALLISLGTVLVLSLLHININPALPAVFGAVGAAAYAVKLRKE